MIIIMITTTTIIIMIIIMAIFKRLSLKVLGALQKRAWQNNMQILASLALLRGRRRDNDTETVAHEENLSGLSS